MFFWVTVGVYIMLGVTIFINCIPQLRKICVKSSDPSRLSTLMKFCCLGLLSLLMKLFPFTRVHGSPLFVGESLWHIKTKKSDAKKVLTKLTPVAMSFGEDPIDERTGSYQWLWLKTTRGVMCGEWNREIACVFFSPWGHIEGFKKCLLNHMGVSKNRGTPKWMVYNGKPY